MAPLIQAERWCEEVVQRSVTTLRAIRCGTAAVTLCASCDRAVCDAHESFCVRCKKSFCRRCDHTCLPEASHRAIA